MSIPVWAVLAFATWTIAILMLGVGVYRWSLILAGKAELKSFPGDEPHGSPLYRRAVRAHANCVENLPVFTAIVLAVQASGDAHSSMLDVLSLGVVTGLRGAVNLRAQWAIAEQHAAEHGKTMKREDWGLVNQVNNCSGIVVLAG